MLKLLYLIIIFLLLIKTNYTTLLIVIFKKINFINYLIYNNIINLVIIRNKKRIILFIIK